VRAREHSDTENRAQVQRAREGESKSERVRGRRRWGPADKWLRVCGAHCVYAFSSVGARVVAGRRLLLPAVLGVAINGNHLVTEAVRSGEPPPLW